MAWNPFAATMVRSIFNNPQVRNGVREFGQEFTGTLLQDQYESATGTKVKSPPPQSGMGAAGSLFGTYVAAHAPKFYTAPPNGLPSHLMQQAQQQLVQRTANFYSPVQGVSYLQQKGFAKPDAQQLYFGGMRGNLNGQNPAHIRQLYSSFPKK